MSWNIQVICALLLMVLGVNLGGCSRKKVPLDEKEFTALLIDMHRTDGSLAVLRGLKSGPPSRNYAYYNDLFQKHGITRADFDSCMYYYSGQTVRFSKIYDMVIDSLNKELTAVNLVLNELKSRDSVNWFPQPDTLSLDSGRIVEVIVDSIVPGLYKFNTTIQFDTFDMGKNNRITSFFLSSDGEDTLRIRELRVMTDTLERKYSWSQYADSVYDRLVIRFVEADNPKKLEARRGRAWNTELFHPYISRQSEQRFKQTLERRRK